MNSQHSMLDFHKENTALLKNKFQGILTTTILSYLVFHNNLISDLYMDDISDIKYQLHHLHLK